MHRRARRLFLSGDPRWISWKKNAERSFLRRIFFVALFSLGRRVEGQDGLVLFPVFYLVTATVHLCL